MFGWITALLSPVAEVGKQYLDNKKAKAQAEAELTLAIIKNKARLAESEESHNSMREMKQLEVATPWVRWVIVGHVLALFDVGILNPELAKEVYANFNLMPEWVVGLFVSVFAFYFAVARLADRGADLVASWRAPKEKEDKQ